MKEPVLYEGGCPEKYTEPGTVKIPRLFVRKLFRHKRIMEIAGACGEETFDLLC